MVEPRGICDSEGTVWLESCEEGIFAAVNKKIVSRGSATTTEALPAFGQSDPSTWTNFYRKSLRTDLVGARNPTVLRYWIDPLLLVSCGVGVR